MQILQERHFEKYLGRIFCILCFLLKSLNCAELEPTVDVVNSGNVSMPQGKTASLRCRVLNKGNFTVSWIRHRDLHLLTVAHYTYTTDQRFRALHESSTGDWVLIISSLQPRDEGLYECQIGTTPPKGHFVYLDVMEPVTKISGGEDLHINLASPLNLTCLVLYHPKPPDIVWYHEGKVIEYTSSRGGVSVVTESSEITRSSLLISSAKKTDAGKYTCAPEGGTTSASINVHVLTEENRAAMHSSGSRIENISSIFFTFSIPVYSVILNADFGKIRRAIHFKFTF